MRGHMDDALDGGGDRAGPGDGHRRDARGRTPCRGVCRVVGLRGLDDLAQPKLEMVRGQCHTLEMTLEEVAIIVGQLLPGAARAQMAAQCRHDERLDLGGGNAADQSRRRRLILQHSLGDVIAVAGAALVGVGWAHAVAAIIKQAPAQERGRAPQPAAPRARLGRKLGLHRHEQDTIHNRRLFAAMDLAPVDHLADIEAALEQMGERPHAKAPPADGAAVRQPPRLAANSLAIEILRQRADGAKLEIARKDRANRLRLGWYHNDLLVHRGIPPLTPQPQLVAHRGVVMRQLSVPVTVSPRSLTRLGASPGKMEKSCLARSKCRYFTPADNTGVSRTSAPTPALQPAMD